MSLGTNRGSTPKPAMRHFSVLRLLCALFACALSVPALTAADVPSPVFAYEDVDVKPAPKKKVRMVFPGSTRKGGANPQITLRFVVKPDGSLANVVIVKFSHPDLIEEALRAYEYARFNPGQKDGQSVATRMEVTESLRPISSAETASD